MKGFFIGLFFCCSLFQGIAQKKCVSAAYYNESVATDPDLAQRQKSIEEFSSRIVSVRPGNNMQRVTNVTIKIPVVVHVLYHYPQQKINDEIIKEQIRILNVDFRRKNSDTSLTPARFKNLAADTEIEFVLATSDPRRVSTNGIVKKYTPVKEWENRDKMKLASEYGDDAWDSRSYLNIWVCALSDVAGYSSVPGADSKKDGVVIDFAAFGPNSNNNGYNLGRTLTHETGHWLNLKHIWGDADCGSDEVADTPTQDIYTVGCPSGTRISCNNGPNGNMYMNYMDLSSDECMNMFTKGQKARMLSLFAPGGARESLLYSKGFSNPLIVVRPVELPDPKWLFTKIYPNPVIDKMTINMEYDERWVGKEICVQNITGQHMMEFKITSKIMEMDVSKLKPGVYFLSAKKEDGVFIRHKFLKL